MKKTTKGALAVGTAAVLLLGGVSTLAYWTDSSTVDGTTLNSGNMELGAGTCDAWLIDTEELPSPAFDPAADKIVPGDVLTRSCTYSLTGEGNHLKVEFDASASPSFTGDLASALDLDATIKVGADEVTPGTPVTVSDDTGADLSETVSVDYTVTFPYGATEDNTTQDLSATLGDITLTATQVHDAPVP